MHGQHVGQARQDIAAQGTRFLRVLLFQLRHGAGAGGNRARAVGHDVENAGGIDGAAAAVLRRVALPAGAVERQRGGQEFDLPFALPHVLVNRAALAQHFGVGAQRVAQAERLEQVQGRVEALHGMQLLILVGALGQLLGDGLAER